MSLSTRGEMDIMTDFGSVVVGSSPAGCTQCIKANCFAFMNICAGRRDVLPSRAKPCLPAGRHEPSRPQQPHCVSGGGRKSIILSHILTKHDFKVQNPQGSFTCN